MAKMQGLAASMFDRLPPAVGLLLGGSLLLGRPASATTSYVDTSFDRSAWEAAVSGIVTNPFDNTIAQADTLDFDSGIQSVASGANGSPNHFVDGGRFNGTLRTSGSTAPGYLTFVWTFPVPVTAFAADFFSIGGSREVSVQGTFDSGLESFDLRTLFVNDGGVDQGFFGLTSTMPFTSITLVALGSIDSNDSFTVDNAAFAVPEPANPDFVALAALGLAGRFLRRKRGQRRGRPAAEGTQARTGEVRRSPSRRPRPARRRSRSVARAATPEGAAAGSGTAIELKNHVSAAPLLVA